MRTLITVKNPGIRTTANMAIDELFSLAKGIAAAEKMGGARQAVMSVDQEVAEGGNQFGEAMGVLNIGGNKINGRRSNTMGGSYKGGYNQPNDDKGSTCFNCNSNEQKGGYAPKEVTIIKVDQATRDISDESQVAFSELGLEMFTAKDCTAAVVTTGSQPGRLARILETVFWICQLRGTAQPGAEWQ